MTYISMTKPGITRGPHEHKEQSDFFCFMGPSTFRLYLWDNRLGLSSYGMKCHFDFGEDQMAAVIVPPGVVHAYRNIGTVDGLVFNAPNKLYAGQGKSEPVDEIRHENIADSKFRIDE
jgi:dTDP-4-dehydrorhamnose 3,5-epimerase